MRHDKRKKAIATLKRIDKDPSAYYIIHYSCESFYDTTDGRSPRITSIAILSLTNRQTESFSIHKLAEREHISFGAIEEHYDSLEKKMLDEYFKFLKNHKGFKWIHWNMRNPNFGFKAIEHRFLVLGGKNPEVIPDERLFDLAALLHEKYGDGYIPDPKMVELVKLNKLYRSDFLTGKEEADAFRDKEFIRLHLSTLAKVNSMASLLESAADSSLKTKAKWRNQYGVSIQGIVDVCKDKWYLQLGLWAITLIAGGLIGVFLNSK